MAQIKQLSEDLQKIAIEELNEVPSRIPDDLQALKLWIQQQPHLRARTDDQFLIQFLRGCKYSLERAKEKIDKFYALRTKYPELLSSMDVDNVKFREAHNLGCIVPLPTPLHGSGPRIIMFRFNYAANKYNIEDIFRPSNAMHELLMLNDPYACIYGTMYVVDMATATTSHLMQFSPSIMTRLNAFYEKTLPLRVKALCYINVSNAAEQFFKILLACFSEKLRQRVYICGKNMNNLTDRLPLQYLPQDYGGENGCLDQLTKDYNKVWDEYREYFKQNHDYGTDERLRPGQPIDFDGIYGLGGSFRKIDLD